MSSATETAIKVLLILTSFIGWVAILLALHRIEDAIIQDGMLKESICIAMNTIAGIGCVVTNLYIVDSKRFSV